MLSLQKNNIIEKGKEFNNPLFLQFHKGHDKGIREKLIIGRWIVLEMIGRLRGAILPGCGSPFVQHYKR